MSLVIYSVTVSLHKWHGQASRPRVMLACFSIDHFLPPRTKLPGFYDVLLTLRLLREWKFRGKKIEGVDYKSHSNSRTDDLKTHWIIWPYSLQIRSFLEISWALLRVTFHYLSLLPWLFPSLVHFLHEINEESDRLRFQRTYDSWVTSIFFSTVFILNGIVPVEETESKKKKKKRKKVFLEKQWKVGTQTNLCMFHVDLAFQGQHLNYCMNGSLRKNPNHEHMKGS